MDLEHYMSTALAEAEKALSAGEFPVGCVVVLNGQILAAGSRSGTQPELTNEIDHAEMIALRRLTHLDPMPDLSQAVLFTSLEPCLMCFGAILLSGIQRIVYAYEDVMGGGTACDLSTMPPLYRDSNLEVIPHVRRKESLALLQSFFANPQNQYWKGSLLETYTMNQ